MVRISKVSRRDFLKITGAAGTGLVLGLHLPLGRRGLEASTVNGLQPNVWLRIDPEGVATLWVHRSELGQGARTALPQILADELEIEWPEFERQQAIGHPKYGSQTTGGSTSVRTSWDPLRKAGATARAMLVAAAAAEWGVGPGACRASKGRVHHEASGRSLGYGELATKAAEMPVPEDPPLKDPADFRYIGKPIPHLDNPARVEGTATFGIDFRLPDMLYASVAQSPVFGGTLKSYDPAPAKRVTGVRDVVEIDGAIAVAADSTWAAMRGLRALKVEWDPGDAADLSSESITRMMKRHQDDEGIATREEGDFDSALAGAERTFREVFEVPFIAHAPLEPMNCTAHANDDSCEIWAPSQAPQWARRDVAAALGLAEDQVTVHVTFSGGAFGRRLIPDFAVQAALISKAVGAPIHLTWTREEDMGHDFYRPTSRHILEGGLDAEGKPVAWRHRVIAPSIVGPLLGADDRRAAGEATGGAAETPYAIPNIRVDYVKTNTPVPTGWWRSVFHSQTAFANECFVDQLAAAAGTDPLRFRLELLRDAPKHRRVLELAAEKANWDQPPPAGRARGLALHASFHSYAAEVAEVSVNDEGAVKVHRVVCAVDCGTVVNPDGAAAQVEGGIALGLTAALHGQITLENGRVVQRNYDFYPLLTMAEMPEVEVHFVPSQEPPTGIGEPPVPPIAPAVVNAIHAASGVWVRRLPIRKEELRKA